MIKTKRCDLCFYTDNSNYGLIECFAKFKDTILVIYKQIVILYAPFYSILRPDIRSRSSICYISEQYRVEDIRKINKAVFIKISEKEMYVSDFSMSQLFS